MGVNKKDFERGISNLENCGQWFGKGGNEMEIRKFEIDRLSVRSAKPFEAVVSALKAAVWRFDVVEFTKVAMSASSFAELEELVGREAGPGGLMLFMEFDQGSVLRKETGFDKPKIVRLLIGNPLIMKEMAKHVPDAGSYAPVTVLIDERDDGVHLSYDKMTSLLAPYGNTAASAVAQDLDIKVETLLRECAA